MLTSRARGCQQRYPASDAAGARDQFSALLPIYERVLGPEHPDTLTTHGNLAYWTKKARSGR